MGVGNCYLANVIHISRSSRVSFLRSLLAPRLPLILSLFYFITLPCFFPRIARKKYPSPHFLDINQFFSLLFFFLRKETLFLNAPYLSQRYSCQRALSFFFFFFSFFSPFSFLSSFVNFCCVPFSLYMYIYIFLSLSLSLSVHNRELSPRHPSNPPVLDVFPRQCTYGASYIRDNGIFLVESNLLEITFHRDYLAFRRFRRSRETILALYRGFRSQSSSFTTTIVATYAVLAVHFIFHNYI